MVMNKGNKLLILALLTLVFTASAFFITYNQYLLNASAPYILYTFEDAPKCIGFLNSNQRNTFSVTVLAHNAGKTEGTFTLLISFINATFSDSTQESYNKINNTCISFSWTLHSAARLSSTLSYLVDENAKGFSITLSIDKESAPMKTTELYPYNLEYTYNSDLRYFELKSSY